VLFCCVLYDDVRRLGCAWCSSLCTIGLMEFDYISGFRPAAVLFCIILHISSIRTQKVTFCGSVCPVKCGSSQCNTASASGMPQHDPVPGTPPSLQPEVWHTAPLLHCPTLCPTMVTWLIAGLRPGKPYMYIHALVAFPCCMAALHKV